MAMLCSVSGKQIMVSSLGSGKGKNSPWHLLGEAGALEEPQDAPNLRTSILNWWTRKGAICYARKSPRSLG